MLPAQHRLRTPDQFRSVLRERGGMRQAHRLLVIQVRRPLERRTAPTRVGLVVSKAVGGAVIRNRTKRRLRHLCAQRLPAWGPGYDIVVRANPEAASAGSEELGSALDSAWRRIAARQERRP